MTKDLTSTVRQQPYLILTIPTELSILASDPSDHLPPVGSVEAELSTARHSWPRAGDPQSVDL